MIRHKKKAIKTILFWWTKKKEKKIIYSTLDDMKIRTIKKGGEKLC